MVPLRQMKALPPEAPTTSPALSIAAAELLVLPGKAPRLIGCPFCQRTAWRGW